MNNNIPDNQNNESLGNKLYSLGIIPESEIEKYNRRVEHSRMREEVIEEVLNNLSEEDKNTLRNTRKDELIQFHHGLGTYIRNSLRDKGWKEEDPIDNLEYLSSSIIGNIWEKLQTH